MNIQKDNLIEITGLKVGQRVIQVDGKWIVVGVGGKTSSSDGSSSSSSSMEIYKCVDADGMSWWVVSGCGNAEANGRYYEGDPIKSDWGESYKAYYQKDGSCSIQYEYYDGRWALKSGNTILYRNDNWEYYNGDPSQCANWITDSGIEPVPTIAKETTTGNGWSGLHYDAKAPSMSDTTTELTYKYKTPKIGKFYTADGVIECDVRAGGSLLFYAPLHSAKATDELGRTLNIQDGVEFTTYKGVPMAKFDKESISFSCDDLPGANESRTISCFAKCDGTPSGSNTSAFGYGSGDYPFSISVHYSGKWYFGDMRACEVESQNHVLTLSHLAFSYDADTKLLSFYVDGVLVGTRENFTQGLDLQTGRIGSAVYTSSGYVGYVSECKIWNVALSAEEIKAEADRCLAMVTEN